MILKAPQFNWLLFSHGKKCYPFSNKKKYLLPLLVHMFQPVIKLTLDNNHQHGDTHCGGNIDHNSDSNDVHDTIIVVMSTVTMSTVDNVALHQQ